MTGPRRWGRYDRLSMRAAAGTAAAVGVVAAGAAAWAYGWSAGPSVPDLGGVAFVATGTHVLGGWWLRGRDRKAEPRWRAAPAVPGGVHPGLVVRTSRRAFAIKAVAMAGLLGSGLVLAARELSEGHVWYGGIGSALTGLAVPVAASAVFGRVRWSGSVAITARGVAAGGDLLPWDEIAAVGLGEDDVVLRTRSGKSMGVGGPDCVVSDERLAEVLRFYLDNPGRRSGLDTQSARINA